MNLTVSGHHLAVTPAIRGCAEGKFSRTGRHFEHFIDLGIILTVDKLSQKAEVTCDVCGQDIFVDSDDQDLYAGSTRSWTSSIAG
jgi:putative sigma-54 modulation protein